MGTVVSLETRRLIRVKRAKRMFDEDWEDIQYMFSPHDVDSVAYDVHEDLERLDSLAELVEGELPQYTLFVA